MKKSLAILLALILVLMHAAAFAADPAGGTDDTSKWTTGTLDPWTVPIKKNYTVTGATGTVYPAETIAFTSEAATDNPDGGTANLVIADYDVTGATNTNVLTITLPTFTKVGLYHFTISETAGSTQGVTYNPDNTQIKLSILVVYDYDNKCLKIPDGAEGKGITAIGEDKKKTDELKNDYDLGKLTVEKKVTGNMGRKDQAFTIKVTLETETDLKVQSDITVSGGSDSGNTQTVAKGWTGKKEITIKLMDSEKVTVDNIPAGVTYTVVEDSSHEEADPNGSDGSKGYTISYENESDQIEKGTTKAAVVTNDKTKTIDTGISMETVPYIMILALALIVSAVLFIRKREEY